MSKTRPTYNPERLQQYLKELRADFDTIRQSEHPVKLWLVHRASNAEAEGVTDYPPSDGREVGAFLSACHRKPHINCNSDGTPCLIDPPILNPDGKPYLDPKTGRGLDITLPATRFIELKGDDNALSRLQSLAVRGGKLATACRDRTLRLLAGWQFANPDCLWWVLVFELAWSGRHPLLSAERRLWHKTAKGATAFLPHDLQKIQRLASFPTGILDGAIPEAWKSRLPDAYVSEIGDAASACRDLATVLIDELEEALSAGPEEQAISANDEQSAKPDEKGYVASPPDPSAYVPASKIVSEHTPDTTSLTMRQLTAILEDYAKNRVRWMRPAGKDGSPRSNRRHVHLTDWLAYVRNRERGGAATDEDAWPLVSPEEGAARAEAIRSQRQAGK